MTSLIGMIDLSGMQLGDASLKWLHAMPVGKKVHPEYGELDFGLDHLQRYAENINNRARTIDLAVDYQHREDKAKGAKAAGWIKGAEVRADGLWIGVEFTDTARQEIQAGEWRYLSPEFVDEWQSPEGEWFQDVLLGAGLTNRPFLKDLLPIAASESSLLYPSKSTSHDDGRNTEVLSLLALAARRRRVASRREG